MKDTIMKGDREYCENMDVTLNTAHSDRSRVVIKAYNEAGCKTTEVDLMDIINWLRVNRPLFFAE